MNAHSVVFSVDMGNFLVSRCLFPVVECYSLQYTLLETMIEFESDVCILSGSCAV